MKEKYLIINAGSSSLKFSLYEMPDNIEIVNGIVEKIGEGDSSYTLKFNGQKVKKSKEILDHECAANVMMEELLQDHFINDISEIAGVGHRILHGGEFYDSSVLIDEEVFENIKSLTKLGPLHHPGELAGISSITKIMPNASQVAVFDTSFHQTMPKENYLYAVPYSWYTENGVRKYGFHGTSHRYITERLKGIYGENVNAIICHIGSGASISCIKDGKCYDTSMGLTPLDGLVMGTRCGSIDPSIIDYISKERGLTIAEINEILNKKSGLLGMCGKNDFRDVTALAESGNENAINAIKIMENSITKYIANYYLELDGNVNALVFTAGCGENASSLRKDIMEKISCLGVKIDENMNNKIAGFKDIHEGIISEVGSSFDCLVIPTNEEYMILNDTYNIIKDRKNVRVLEKKINA